MTAEATTAAQEHAGSAGMERGRQASRRDSLEAVGLLLGILLVLIVVTLVGVAPPG